MASCSGNGSRGHHKFTLNVNETYVSGGAENYSTVSWSLVLSPITNGYNWSYSSTVPVSYKVTINGTDYTGNIMSYDGRSTVTIQSGTQNVTHNNDGTKAISFNFSVWDNVSASYLPGSASGNGNLTLTTIARYTSITSFTVSKRNETSLVFNWGTANTIDYLWYSTNNGGNWTGLDVTDGTSGNFTVSGLSPNTTYNCKIRVRRKDSQLTTDSGTVSQTTYKAPSQSLNARTETTIKMNWSADTNISKVEYSKDNGSTWTVVTNNANATSGNYTISNLNSNTTYNIKTRLTRSATSTNYATGTTAVTTYDYPYVTAVGTAELLIGNQQTLTLYNPLSRSVTVRMNQNNASGAQLYSGTTSGTSISFTPNANTLYASIPNNQSGVCVYSVVYGSVTKTTGTRTYKIRGTETPTFNNFTYIDSNTTVTNVTGNNQIMVKGLSTVQVTILSANKMVAQNSATGKSYSFTMSNLSGTTNYSNSDIVKSLGTINASGTQRLSVTAYDSRNLSKTVYKDITVYDYSKPVINASITRLNNFENDTTIRVQGTYNKLTINNIDKNNLTSVQYRYRESNGSWGNWINFTTTVNNGAFTCSDVVLSLDNTKSFDFEIRATDSLQQTTTNSYVVDVGKAAFFVKKDGGFQANGNSEINGDLEISGKKVYLKDGTANTDVQYVAKRTDTNTQIWLGIGSGGVNHGVYSNKLDKWILHADGTGVYVNGIKDEHGTANSTDTWIPVYASNKIQHTLRAIWTTKTHTNYGTNNDYLATLSCLSWWNGAYSSSNASNLTYAHQGTIQCKPTNLYNNTSGSNGTITLSQTSGNFTYLDIFYRDQENNYGSTRIYSANGKKATLQIATSNTSYNNVWVKPRVINISGTSITTAHYGEAAIVGGTYGKYNQIHIVRVDGWL